MIASPVDPSVVKADGKRQLRPFGVLVKHHRQRKGLTQAVLARRSRISPGYVGLIETGERGASPSEDIVKRLAQALKLNREETEQLLRSSGHLGKHEPLVLSNRPTFAAFISSDSQLTDQQKDLLVGLYESWMGHTD